MFSELGQKAEKWWTRLFLAVFLLVPLTLIARSAVYAIFFFAVILLVTKKVKFRNFAVTLFLFSLAIRVFLVLALPVPVESDYSLMLEAAEQLREGNFSYLASDYFRLWAYQIGFVFYETCLLRIWDSVCFLKLVNCVVCASNVLLVYLLAKEFSSEKAARFVSVVYSLFPMPLFYVTILTNQHLYSFLVYLGFYLLLSERLRWGIIAKCLIFAVILAFANVIRPESIIPLLSAVIYLLLSAHTYGIRKSLTGAAVLAAAFWLFFRLLSNCFVWTGLSPLGLTNNAPYWKFLLGLNSFSSGGYSEGDLIFLLDSEGAWREIKARAHMTLAEYYSLFERKIEIFWSGIGIDAVFHSFREEGVTLFGLTFRTVDDEERLDFISRWIAFVFYLFTVLAIPYDRRQGKRPGVLLLMNQVFVTLGVYLLIEVQPRYSYHIQMSVAVLAALGVDALCGLLRRLKQQESGLGGEAEAPPGSA